MQKLFAVFLTIGFLLWAGPALAADYYVDGDSGSDVTGDGSAGTPYATITQALTVISGGDTIYCRGNIVDSFTLTSAQSGAAGAYTTITVWPDGRAEIDGNGVDYIVSIEANANYIRVDDLSFTNAVRSVFYGVDPAENWIITNNYISGLTGGEYATAIDLTTVDNLEISNNQIDGGGSLSEGISLSGVNGVTISGNSVKNITNLGVVLDDETADAVIKNNWIYNIGGEDNPYNAGLAVADSHDVQVLNNSFYYTYDGSYDVAGIEIMTSSHDLYDVTVKNNIFQAANYAVSLDYAGYTGLEFDYNIYNAATNVATISGTDYLDLANWQTATGFDANSSDEDPLYASTMVNEEDLHLQDGSPAIDAGELSAEVIEDYDQETRPYNLMDIGVDERPVLAAAPDSLSSNPKVRETTLSWLMSEDYPVTGYLLTYSSAADLSGGTIIECDENAVATLTGLKPAKKYYAAVQGVYETDYGVYLSPSSEILEFGTKPAQVTKLKNLITVHNYSQWRWKKQRRVRNYVLKLMDSDGQTIEKIYVKKSQSFVRNSQKKFVKYIIDELASGRVYKIKVRARKKVNNEWLLGRWSKTKTLHTLADPVPEI